MVEWFRTSQVSRIGLRRLEHEVWLLRNLETGRKSHIYAGTRLMLNHTGICHITAEGYCNAINYGKSLGPAAFYVRCPELRDLPPDTSEARLRALHLPLPLLKLSKLDVKPGPRHCVSPCSAKSIESLRFKNQLRHEFYGGRKRLSQ